MIVNDIKKNPEQIDSYEVAQYCEIVWVFYLIYWMCVIIAFSDIFN